MSCKSGMNCVMMCYLSLPKRKIFQMLRMLLTLLINLDYIPFASGTGPSRAHVLLVVRVCMRAWTGCPPTLLARLLIPALGLMEHEEQVQCTEILSQKSCMNQMHA